jgi:hypothetical protein
MNYRYWKVFLILILWRYLIWFMIRLIIISTIYCLFILFFMFFIFHIFWAAPLVVRWWSGARVFVTSAHVSLPQPVHIFYQSLWIFIFSSLLQPWALLSRCLCPWSSYASLPFLLHIFSFELRRRHY